MSEEPKRSPENCPYCGKLLSHPYWAHVQEKHPEEYNKRKTWIKLFNDYTGMGMTRDKSLQIIGELFNSSPEEVKDYLKRNKIL